jgi:hypothetical protein
MYPTFWKLMQNYNKDNTVKFIFKFPSIFQTQEKIDYYIAVLDRQLLQHVCQAYIYSYHAPTKCYISSHARIRAYQSCYQRSFHTTTTPPAQKK